MLNPIDYVKHATAAYPTLYYTGDFNRSAMKVYDQLFNVIGNGIRDDLELHAELSAQLRSDIDYDRYFSELPLSEGYTKISQSSLDMMERLRKNPHISEEDIQDLVFPDHDSAIPGLFTDAEKESHPEVLFWKQLEPSGFSPYPNFKEEYSIVYQSDFKKLGLEWLDAAIWFYTECQKYFEPELINYHGSYPSDNPNTDAATRRGYEENFARGKYKDNTEISNAYGVEYTGDLDDFIKRRWLKEKERIGQFLVNTVEYLKHMRMEVAPELNIQSESLTNQ